jgi:hypothetical protein
MGSKYSSQAVSGFDSSPPVDDGSATEANKVKWSTIKNKLASPLKTHAEAINTALVTALDQSCRTVSANDAAAASDHDRTIQVTTSSVTITLADATTMAAGYVVSVANMSNGAITVALATATDTIDTVTNATQTIEAKEVKTYIVNTAAVGYISKARYGAIPDLTEDTSPDLEADYVETYDASATRRKKVLLGRLGSGLLETEVPTTTGVVIDFTGIPSWAKRITVQFVGVSTSGTNSLLVQIGDAGGVEDTGYLSATSGLDTGVTSANSTAGFIVAAVSSGSVLHGAVVLTLEDSANFTWVSAGTLAFSSSAATAVSAGSKSLSAALTTVRITTVGGSDTFDAGAVNILVE